MSRRAECYDTALAESAFRSLKEEAFGPKSLETMDDARRAVFAFMEGNCNHERLRLTLAYGTPRSFEKFKVSEKFEEQEESSITLVHFDGADSP